MELKREHIRAMIFYDLVKVGSSENLYIERFKSAFASLLFRVQPFLGGLRGNTAYIQTGDIQTF